MTLLVDRFINLCKWPLALSALVCLLPAMHCSARVIALIIGSAHSLQPFLFGLFGYLVFWMILFRHRTAGSFLSTLEHECTHAIVALLTLHGVRGMRVTWNEGGHVRYTGGVGNWLITISPYFIPTISILAILVTQFMAVQQTPVSQGVIGATVGFHLGSSYLETHDAQSDLKKVGYVFCLCFLPTANLLVYSLLLAFIWDGSAGLTSTLDYFFELSINAFQWFNQKPSF